MSQIVERLGDNNIHDIVDNNATMILQTKERLKETEKGLTKQSV